MDDAGYKELEHTADWALKVWAPDLESLLVTAAKGMYEISEVVTLGKDGVEEQFSLVSQDDESLLVDFLSELLYYAEKDNIAFLEFNLTLDQSSLEAKLVGRPIKFRKKEIKAVTYHNLEISRQNDKLEVTIVFDV